MEEVTAQTYEPSDGITILVTGSIASEADLIRIIREAFGAKKPEDEEPQTPEPHNPD